MPTATPRATRSTLDRAEDAPVPVAQSVVDAANRQIASLFGRRQPFSGRVKLWFDAERGFIVDGTRQTIDPVAGEADCEVLIKACDLKLMMRSELDPRQALVFGGMVVRAGSVARAVEFGDFLTGRPLEPPKADRARTPQPVRDWEQARRELAAFGYALVEGALTGEELARLRARVVEQAAAERAAGKASVGESAQRLWNLINKGRSFHDLLLNPLVEAFVADAIGSHALLHGFVAQIALPGNAPSIMHYDQIAVQPKVDFQIGLNLLWFLDDVCEANGGTRIVPGSHHRHVGPADPFVTDGTVAAAGPAGTALLLDSRVWHSVGSNVTARPRHVIASYFVRSYMRTQENYFLSLLPDVYQKLDDRVRVMLGFRCTGSLGGVEGPVEGQMVTWPGRPVGELSRAPEANSSSR